MASILAAFLLFAVSLPQATPDPFTPAERNRLAAQVNVDDRIKVYTAAVADRSRALAAAMAGQRSEAASEVLVSWTALLAHSLQDIQSNAGRKSKSRALRRFEIELRKAIGAVDDLKMKGTFEQMQEFESWVEHAERVRGAVVEILFPK